MSETSLAPQFLLMISLLRINKRDKGLALIVTVGILAMMTIIASSFSINMMVDGKASVNNAESLKAQYAAEAGIAAAIANLKTATAADFNAAPSASDSWNNNSLGDSGRGMIATYSLKVTDTASQVNINDPNPRVRDILGHLAVNVGLTEDEGRAIYDNRPATNYATKEEILDRAGLDRTQYRQISDFVTTESYIDQNSEDDQEPGNTLSDPPTYQPKSPININTASQQVLEAVLVPVMDATKAQTLTEQIINERSISAFKYWSRRFDTGATRGGFDEFIGDRTQDTDNPGRLLSPIEGQSIKDNANPNKVKPSGYSTDFCFHPSGIYEITSTGKIGIDVNGNNNLEDSVDTVVAQKTVMAVVKICDIVNYTTKEQFRGDNGILPVYCRVTWMNSCPVDSGSLFGHYAVTNPIYVHNSIKLGYWDNFDEDQDYTKANWSGNVPVVFDDLDKNDSDNELTNTTTKYIHPHFYLNNPDWLSCKNFSLRVSEFDYETWIQGKFMAEVGIISFREDRWAFLSRKSVHSWGGNPLFYAYEIPPPAGKIWFWTEAEGEGDYGKTKYMYDSQIRMYVHTFDDGGVDKQDYDWDIYRKKITYNTKKTYNLYANDSTVTLSAYTYNDGDSKSLTRADADVKYGRFGLYGRNYKVAWDDIRIIPGDRLNNAPNGYYQLTFILPNGSGNVNWGTASWTTTIPLSANPGSETCNVSVGKNVTSLAAIAINSPVGITDSTNSIVYKVDFNTNDADYSETPVFEDITFTYFPKTQILYWRNM